MLSFYAGDTDSAVRGSVILSYQDPDGVARRETFAFRETAAKLELRMASQAILGQNAEDFLIRADASRRSVSDATPGNERWR